jgi:hypothetical protein
MKHDARTANAATISLLPLAFVTLLSGCSSTPPVAPPPVTPVRPTVAARGTVDPLPRDEARQRFDDMPAARGSARPVAASTRPSALPMFDMTLAPESPKEVASLPVAQSEQLPPAVDEQPAPAPAPAPAQPVPVVAAVAEPSDSEGRVTAAEPSVMAELAPEGTKPERIALMPAPVMAPEVLGGGAAKAAAAAYRPVAQGQPATTSVAQQPPQAEQPPQPAPMPSVASDRAVFDDLEQQFRAVRAQPDAVADFAALKLKYEQLALAEGASGSVKGVADARARQLSLLMETQAEVQKLERERAARDTGKRAPAEPIAPPPAEPPVPAPAEPAAAPTPEPAPVVAPAPVVVPPAPPAPEPPAKQPAIGTLSMASKVRGFGDIEPIDAGSLRAGDRFLAYVELMHWPFVAGIGDRMTAHARYMLRIEDAKGTVIWKEGPFDAIHSSPVPTDELFITRMVKLPRTIPAGSYSLVVAATDMATGAETDVRLPFAVKPPAKR